MSVKLRLTRLGRKKRPFYRIVAIDSRASRDGGYLEKIGTYDPLSDPAAVHIDKLLALKWLKNGAQPSTTVRNLLRKDGILLELELSKRGLNAEEITLEMKKWDLGKQERQKKAEAMAAMKRRAEEKKTAAEAKAKAKQEAEVAAKEAAEEDAATAASAESAQDAATVEESPATSPEAEPAAEDKNDE